MLGFGSFVILLIDNSSFIIVDWQMSKSFKMLFTLSAFSWVVYSVAFVSQHPNSPRRNIILYGDVLYAFTAIVRFFYSLHIYGRYCYSLLQNLWFGLNSKWDRLIVVYFDHCYIDEFGELKNHMHFQLMVLNVFIAGCLKGRTLNKLGFFLKCLET